MTSEKAKEILFYGGIVSGRTTAIINAARAHGHKHVIVASEAHARRLRREYPDMQFITPDDLERSRSTDSVDLNIRAKR